jgi:hypothetical protein
MEDEKVDKRKGKGKYWYYITEYECVLCWHSEVYRERRYTPKPKEYKDRHEFHQTACGSHF